MSKAIARLDKVTPSQTESVLEEFCQLTGQGGAQRRFRLCQARARQRFRAGGGQANRRSSAAGRSPRSTRTSRSLQKADPNQLSRFIESEHPQTIALILSHLSPSQAASLLANLPTAAAFGRNAAHRATGSRLARCGGAHLHRHQREVENSGRSEDGAARRPALRGRNPESHGRHAERRDPGQLAG